MTILYTIDASVFVSAYNDYEVDHEISHQLLAVVRQRAIPLIEPTLLLPEITAAVARVYQNSDLALTFADSIRDLPHLSLVTLDASTADLAVGVAAHHRLRGSDAVYAAVAQRYGSTLVTLDQEQYERVEEIVATRSPAEVVADLAPEDEEEG